MASTSTSGTGTLLGSVESAIQQSEQMEGGEEATTKHATEVAAIQSVLWMEPWRKAKALPQLRYSKGKAEIG